MSNWRFTTANKLIAPNGQPWSAKSGPYGKGRLPKGQYTIGSATTISSGNKNRSYRDPSGFAWWCPIAPDFNAKRDGLGIHPDGGVPGTLGCIGLTSVNTRSAYNALRNAIRQKLVVE